ncbi:N-acetylmuramoyl-L-alanine amidase [Leptolyngbya sp. Cla-17]|uniref:N-acetylmuramoyl-L-alanine amidase family protein n=1 Tax=Leptolyngbya sp. Cla-17 TaxID=2803751 RepID=UPI0027DBE547|nr:N-acetylmuramoyl-L-alanine amidase [Leptolyngbya sp. Cla-17]
MAHFYTLVAMPHLGLATRVQIAKRMNATLFVSIHANAISMSRPEVNGLETYYFSSGENLARTVHERVLQETGIGDLKVRKARFYVLRYTEMLSILVEVGFLTGQNGAPKLAEPAYRSQTAAAIARGIMQYLQVGNPQAIAPNTELSRGVSFSKMKKVLCPCLDPALKLYGIE